MADAIAVSIPHAIPPTCRLMNNLDSIVLSALRDET